MKKRFILLVCLILAFALAGCAPLPAETTPQAVSTPAAASPAPTIAAAQTPVPAETSAAISDAAPKYIFLFIGDGMSFAQINTTQFYSGSDTEGNIAVNKLCFSQFPVTGTVTTYNLDSAIPDSASAGTAIACGVKTGTGMLGQTEDGAGVASIAEMLRAAGRKIGIITSVTLNNATPAAFYAHTDSRTDYDEITQQMAESGFDYFGGGAIYTKSEDDYILKDYSLFEQQGYTIADTKAEIAALTSGSGKVYAITPAIAKQGAMPFVIDADEGDLTLADFVGKGIDVLDNENGFFMMCESGKIDWACHANDAATVVQEMLDFNDAIQKAVDFADAHPDETLILVTADHETGGMSLGYTATEYDTHLKLLSSQQMSYSIFKAIIADMVDTTPNLELNDVLPLIQKNFGLCTKDNAAQASTDALVLSDYEYDALKNAFGESVKSSANRTDNEESELLYGGYDPLTMSLTHILDNKAGIGWTTYYHTGLPVPVYAMGAGADLFGGSYDNTGIFDRLSEVCGLSEQIPQ